MNGGKIKTIMNQKEKPKTDLDCKFGKFIVIPKLRERPPLRKLNRPLPGGKINAA